MAPVIVDFNPADDVMRLIGAAFPALTTAGTLAPTAFGTGASAAGAAVRIIHDPGTGILRYDADGNGPGASVRFARLLNADGCLFGVAPDDASLSRGPTNFRSWSAQKSVGRRLLPQRQAAEAAVNLSKLRHPDLDGREQLPLILDHANGVRHDNRPDNLRYLCPNCDSLQTVTRGGANRGRVQDVAETCSGRKIRVSLVRFRPWPPFLPLSVTFVRHHSLSFKKLQQLRDFSQQVSSAAFESVPRASLLAFTRLWPCRSLPRSPCPNCLCLSGSPFRGPTVHSIPPIVRLACFEFPARPRC